MKNCKHCGGTDHQKKQNVKCKQNPANPNFIAPPIQNQTIPFIRNPESAGDSFLLAYANVDDYQNIKVDDIGDMDQLCKHCHSLNFKDEFVSDKDGGHFTLCCHNGKVKIPPFREPPSYIKKLYNDHDSEEAKQFKKHIRNYNNACAFASMSSNLDSVMNKPGAYFFKVNGEVCHYTSKSLHPEENKVRSYSQLYILDTETATNQRMKHSANSKCDLNVNKFQF